MTKYIKNKNVIKRNLAGETVLVPIVKLKKSLRHEEIYVLNQTGSYIWDCLNEPLSAKQIAMKISTCFTGCSEDEVAGDVNEVLSILLKKNLIKKYE